MDSSQKTEQAGGAQSLRRAVAVMRVVAAAQERGARLVDVVEEAGLARPTAHRLLQVLREEGIVEQDIATRRYRIGPELTLLGMARGNRFPIRAIAQPFLYSLSERVADTLFLTVRQGPDSIGIERISGSFPIQVRATDIGVRRPLGVGVGGVAILSALEPAEAQELTRANARRLSRHKLTPALLLERVVRARECGYAWAPVGLVPGSSALSVPVISPRDGVLAAISVAAMADRLTPARMPAVARMMVEEARRIASRSDEVSVARPQRAPSAR